MSKRSELGELVRADTPVHTRTVGSPSTISRKASGLSDYSVAVVIWHDILPFGLKHTHKKETSRAISNLRPALS